MSNTVEYYEEQYRSYVLAKNWVTVRHLYADAELRSSLIDPASQTTKENAQHEKAALLNLLEGNSAIVSDITPRYSWLREAESEVRPGRKPYERFVQRLIGYLALLSSAQPDVIYPVINGATLGQIGQLIALLQGLQLDYVGEGTTWPATSGVIIAPAPGDFIALQGNPGGDYTGHVAVGDMIKFAISDPTLATAPRWALVTHVANDSLRLENLYYQPEDGQYVATNTAILGGDPLTDVSFKALRVVPAARYFDRYYADGVIKEALIVALHADRYSAWLKMALERRTALWVDNFLRERGVNAALAAFSPSAATAFPQLWDEHERIESERFFAVENQAILTRAFTALGDSASLDDVLSQVAAAITRQEHAWSVANVQIPALNWQLKASRDGIKYNLPIGKSLNTHKRNWVMNNVNRRFNRAVEQDAYQHAQTATSPAAAALAGQAADMAKSVADDAAAKEAAARAAILAANGQTPNETVKSKDPQDKQELVKDIAEAVQPGTTGLHRPLVPATTIQVVTLNAAGKTIDHVRTGFVVVDSPFDNEHNITILSPTDYNDFRITGLIKGLKDRVGTGNYTENLAKLTVIDRDSTKDTAITDMVTNNFLLQGFRESYEEKVQIEDTLGDGFLLFTFGQKPLVWQINGLLINDLYTDGLTKFRAFYKDNMRASQLARRRYRLLLSIPGSSIKIYCYPLTLDMQTQAGLDEAVTFSMQFVVIKAVSMPNAALIVPSKAATAQASSTDKAKPRIVQGDERLLPALLTYLGGGTPGKDRLPFTESKATGALTFKFGP